MKKIALLFSHYGPYHLARIESLFNRCQESQWEVVGIELARSEGEYPWKTQLTNFPFPIVSLFKDRDLEKTRLDQLIWHLYVTLSQIQPDILAISGYFRPTMIGALIWCIFKRKIAIVFSDSKEDDSRRFLLRETLKAWILKCFHSAVVAGRPHKHYFIKLGMPAKAIFLGYDVVGNAQYHPERIRFLPQPLDQPFFLTVSRFILKKNLLFLILSYAAYRRTVGSDAWDLVLCGDGSLRSQIEQYIAELGLKDVVHLPGFLQQDELLPYFAHARCFIHASIQEQWGLVVNEAMAAGLPVLVSDRCGCFEDLVVEGVNGFGFDPENSQQLTELMVKISSGEIDLEKMGQAALEHIQKFSPDYFAQGLMQAVEYALAHR
ncbi:glycosyltransferase [Kamptonema formosum]|uniref:glycosyltransferase n=1 Tax=Kamptonema formosum TaxID=331992 RepID=UPI0003478E80|nr:glycosyltransferase [Oscillatoria sp. PCC 10802]